MADDIEQRLAAAAGSMREHEVTTRRHTELRDRAGEMAKLLDSLGQQHAEEQQDVDRLEGMSLTRIIASLRGARDDALARERAEADAARYRVAEAQARLEAVEREIHAAQACLGQLATAPHAYAALIDEKERHLSESADPRRGPLLELAGERGRLTGELREIDEALRAASSASQALSQVERELDSASGWSTYDTFLGGGAISSAIKHSRLDDAARAAAHADSCLAVLRTELADVEGIGVTAPQLAIDGLTRFVDIWIDNIFTDLAVRDRIKRAQESVAGSVRLVAQVRTRLEQRAAEARARLAAIEAERRDLLIGA